MALIRTKTVKETKKLAYLSNVYKTIDQINKVKTVKKKKTASAKIKTNNVTISKQEIIKDALSFSFTLAFAALGYILAKLIQ
ncbi:MAG: hypothetical protein KatS3mg084_0093 [Candidatus Dojkabacteria bacterium]|jgi:hypothetical protein|nr:MAG: hypothetical protein KatS3mg084_0093 [Candidatus Dojkabacteria bacterium]